MDLGMTKPRHIACYLVCTMLSLLGQASCHYDTAREEAYLQEVRFRSAWDYAIGRLAYDQVVKAWGPPTSITSGVAPQGTLLDTAPIRATWHWNHTLPISSATTPPDRNLIFGQRMELVFSRADNILMDWGYWAWGHNGVSYRH
jgi:hypothetical protein